MEEKVLTHINDQGRAKMVDVGEKEKTKRIAKAFAKVKLNEETFNIHSIVFYFDRIELLAHYYKNNNYDKIELNKLVISVDHSSVIEKPKNHDEYFNIADKFINKMKTFETLIGQIEYDVVAIQFKRSEFNYDLMCCYLIHCSYHSEISSDFICHLDDDKADLFIKTANHIWK